MGLFDFLKKKNNTELLDRMTAFSSQALSSASSDIEQYGTFLPFGAVLTTDKKLQLVIYHDPMAESVDPRQHAATIQNIIAQKYEDPDCDLCHMAFDGIAHLPTGDIDAISVRVSHKPSNTHKLFSYPYIVVDGKIQIQNDGIPITADV